MNRGWQSESADGPKGGCFLEWLQWWQRSGHPQLLDVVRCSAAVVAVVVWCSGVVVVMCDKCGVVAVVVVVVVWCN